MTDSSLRKAAEGLEADLRSTAFIFGATESGADQFVRWAMAQTFDGMPSRRALGQLYQVYLRGLEKSAESIEQRAFERQNAYLAGMKALLVQEAKDQGADSGRVAHEFAQWFLANYTLSFAEVKIPPHLMDGVAWRAFLDRPKPAPTKQRPGDQPLPVKNDGPCIQDMVIADIEARKRLGVERYGTPLQPHNQRDALQDAYEEAVDLAMYLKQAIYERDHPQDG